MGFLLGLVAFVGGLVRIRRWSRHGRSILPTDAMEKTDHRYGPGPTHQPAGSMVAAGLRRLLVLDMIWDLVAVLFILAMLLYGAWVAPHLRYVLGVALITVVVCSLAWRTIRKSLARG